MQREIRILANSRKKQGFCVAGKDINNNTWVRIVRDSIGTALSFTQTRYLDINGQPYNIQYEPFNKIMSIDIGISVPLIYQPENFLIGQTPWKEILGKSQNIFYDSPETLWGIGDRIHQTEILNGNIKIDQSLYCIQICDLNLYINDFGRKRISFKYNHTNYDFGATMADNIFNSIKAGNTVHNNAITVSLGDPYPRDGCHYKLCAAIL